MENLYVEELLRFIEKDASIPSMNLSFLRGQLFAVYSLELIDGETFHAYCKKLREIEMEREKVG